MAALSSSLLALLVERCPRALDYAEDHAPRDGDVFAVGTSAHACLDAVHQEIRRQGRPLVRSEARDVCMRTAAALATVGRIFQGHLEPPIPQAATVQGAEIALWHLTEQGFGLPRGALPEQGLAVDKHWRPVAYDAPEAHYRGILDCVGLAEDEYSRLAGYVRDYKTAWNADERLLDSVQMRGQTLLLIAHAETLFGEAPEVIRREIVNLRSGQTFAAEVDLGSIDADVLDDWRAEIDALVAAVPQRGPDGRRAANPGPRCAGCVYRRVCDAVDPDAVEDVADLARRQAAHQAVADALEPILREATADQPMEVDGRIVGWHLQGKREPAPEAVDELAELYAFGVELHPGHRTLLQKVLTSGGVTKALKILRGPDGRTRRQELEERILLTKPARRWGWRNPTPTAADAEQPPADEEAT